MTILIKIADLDLDNKTVLIREDYNVPIQDGVVADESRIIASLPSLTELLKAKNIKIIILSHLGRPKEGQYDGAFSLKPIAECLTKHLQQTVPLIKDWTNGITFDSHNIVLCENVRFEKGEKENDDALARKMKALCDIYINDAFATAHRAQASTYGVAKYTAMACAGPLLIKELKALNKLLDRPARPVTAIVGGAKVSGKLELLHALINRVDRLIIGGGIANTFLKAAGHSIGLSLHEDSLVNEAKQLITQAEKSECIIPLPNEIKSVKKLSSEAEAITKNISEIEETDMIVDIGPAFADVLHELILDSKTIIWNGPMGIFEFDQCAEGTRRVATAVAESSAYKVAGGGDTLAAAAKFGVSDKIDYLSTGGGSFLEFIQGIKLPAIAILEEAARAWAVMERGREL